MKVLDHLSIFVPPGVPILTILSNYSLSIKLFGTTSDVLDSIDAFLFLLEFWSLLSSIFSLVIILIELDKL